MREMMALCMLASTCPFTPSSQDVEDERYSSATTELPGASGPLQSSRRTYLLVHLPEGPRCVELCEGATLTVGRGATCDIVINDVSVSRQHAEFARENGLVRVRDLGSRNGTFARGMKLSGPYILAQGDVISFGCMTASLLFEPPREAGRLGIASYEQLLARTAEEIARAAGAPNKLSLALVRSEGESEGQAEVVAKLRARLRSVDVIAPNGDELLLLLFPGQDASESKVAIERALASLGQFRVGLAAFPEAASSAEALLSRVYAALRATSADARVVIAEREHGHDSAEHEVVVHNAAMRELYALVARVARTPATVLVLGETGTGKELVARSLHAQSPRKNGPFCAINCATIPANLIESTLFGHERGAFTGADKVRKGLLEHAEGGTVFLDEVGDLPPAAQAALLRVLEERTITRVGAVHEIAVDVRVVAATHRDLEHMVMEGTFRADLYHRLNTLTLSLPALRERRDEIAPLVRVFLRELCREWGRAPATFTPEALAVLEAHHWPGNVRELRNVVERALILSTGPELGVEVLPESLAARRGTSSQMATTMAPASPEPIMRDADFPKGDEERILEALRRTGGNQTKAAELLGMPRRTLVYKLKRYGIKKSFERE